MTFNHENLNVYQRLLPFNVKVVIWTGGWDSKHAICDQFSHDIIDDRGYSAIGQSTKLIGRYSSTRGHVAETANVNVVLVSADHRSPTTDHLKESPR